MTYIEENNFHVVMGWSPSNFMFKKIRPTISAGTVGRVGATFTILQEKKDKKYVHTHDYNWLRIFICEFPQRVV